MAAIKKTNTKQEIIDKTIELIKSRDADSLSLADIASACNITKGTLFYYYTSKDLIFIDITLQYLNGLAEEFLSWVDNADKDTSVKRLTNYVIQYGARSTDRGKLHIYLINKALAGSNEIKDLFRLNYLKWRDMLSEKLRLRLGDHYNATDFADLMLIIIDGLIIQDLIGIKHLDIDNITKQLIKV